MLRITDRAYGGDSGGAGSQAVAAGFRHAMSTSLLPESRQTRLKESTLSAYRPVQCVSVPSLQCREGIHPAVSTRSSQNGA
jgi:hypothetical protein